MFNDTQMRQVVVPVADIRDRANGARLRQLLFGEPVRPLEGVGTHVRVQAQRDGYEGIMARIDLGPQMAPTHRVTALATHLYSAPDIKSPELMTLSFGSQLTIVERSGPFSRTHTGRLCAHRACQPGGQTLCRSGGCGRAVSGHALPVGRQQPSGHRLFWAGAGCLHRLRPGLSRRQRVRRRRSLVCCLIQRPRCVAGICCFGKAMWLGWRRRIGSCMPMAAYMATVYEDLSAAVARIQDQGDGPITCRRRLGDPSVRA